MFGSILPTVLQHHSLNISANDIYCRIKFCFCYTNLISYYVLQHESSFGTEVIEKISLGIINNRKDEDDYDGDELLQPNMNFIECCTRVEQGKLSHNFGQVLAQSYLQSSLCFLSVT